MGDIVWGLTRARAGFAQTLRTAEVVSTDDFAGRTKDFIITIWFYYALKIYVVSLFRIIEILRQLNKTTGS